MSYHRPTADSPVGPADLLERVVSVATEPGGPDLTAVAEVLRRGLDVAGCRIELRAAGDGAQHPWPLDRAAGATVLVPVRYAGSQVGTIVIEPGPYARRTRARRVMPPAVTAVLAPILHAALLRQRVTREADAARARAAALAERRRRAIAEQEDERRTLERNLHDGAQHHLVALRLTAGLLEHDLSTGAIRAAQDRLEHFGALLELTESGLTATASGVLPRLLVESGLLAALRAELAGPPAVRVTADSVVRDRRYPIQVEVAVYFACLEAVNNAGKHASGAAVSLSLEHTYRGLAFAVRDDGPGFDHAAVADGSGLRLLGDRIAAAGGDLVVYTAPGAGTTVQGFMPI